MQPLKDRVLLRLEEGEKQTKSGILITKAWEDAKNIGIIEAVGPDVTLVEVTNRVLINPYAVMETPDKELVFVREDDILSIL